jgi:hypothetical protein
MSASGKLDYEDSVKIIHRLAEAAFFHKDHNILIDLRETDVEWISMNELLKLTLEFTKLEVDFKNRLANLIPDNEKRIAIAAQFKACMDIRGFEYEVFTDYEEAIEWLSESKDI